MFCEECGTKNKKGSEFCESCGHKLKVEEKSTKKEEVKETKKEEKKEVVKREPISKNKKILIGVLACVVALLVGSYMYLGSICKPEKVAVQYFKAWAKKDAGKILNYIQIEDSEFVSKDLLKKGLKNEDKIEYGSYRIDKTTENLKKIVGIKEDKLTKSIVIKYTTKDSAREKSKTIKLVKAKGKKYLFFDNWKVDSGDLVVKEYTLNVPVDSTVKIDGVKLDKKYKINSSSSYYNTYRIPSILKGSYKVVVTLESGIELSGDLKVSSSFGTLSSSNLKLDSKNEKKMVENVKEKLTLIYDSAIAQKSFDDIKEEFDEEDRTLIEETYNRIKEYAKADYNKLKEVKITDANVRYYNISKDSITLTMNITYDYKVDYKSGDETKEYEKTGKTSNIYVTYKLDGKDYKLTKLSSIPTYFSHYSY